MLCRVDAYQVDVLSRTFEQTVGKSLKKVLEKELSSWLENGLVLLSLGPLMGDVHLLHRVSFDVVVGRPDSAPRLTCATT